MERYKSQFMKSFIKERKDTMKNINYVLECME
jgi:hypothetical protein